MKSKKVLVHASLALCAMFVLMLTTVGCGRKKAVVYPAEGHAYMKDPVFQTQLKAQEKERGRILETRERLFVRFEELERRAGSRAAAEKLPEWKTLEAEAQDCGRAFESNRVRTTEMLRARMAQAQADSARIKRGEARAVEK